MQTNTMGWIFMYNFNIYGFIGKNRYYEKNNTIWNTYNIINNIKTTFKDVAYTLLGIIYIVGCVIFLSALIILENGKILVGYTIMLSWSTDICAYWAGKTFGKHHFSKVSPKKTIEGCITGALAAVFFGTLYVIVLRKDIFKK